MRADNIGAGTAEPIKRLFALVFGLRPLKRQQETILARPLETFDGEQRIMQARQAGFMQKCDKAADGRTLRYTSGAMPGYNKILVLLDLSAHSEQVAIAGRDMAAHSNAAVVVLHVVEFVPIEPMGEALMPTMRVEPG